MFKSLEETYKGKKVFLTGHTGFKGAWMLKILSMLGAKVQGYALAPENEFDLYHLIDGDKLCTSTIGDLRDKELLKNTILSFQPDFIFHLAAQPLVRLSYEIPSETFEVNAIGTANLLDGVRLLNKPCNVVLITTDKVYHNNEWEYPYRETDRLGGYDPYSASKACAELVIDSYRNSFFNLKKYDEHQKAIAVTRAGNVIGGGDWAKDRLMPDIARALVKNETIEIRNPNSVRPWQHVLEPVMGYLLLGLKLKEDPIRFAQAYNFGPYATDALPVVDMVELAIKAWGCGNYKIKNAADQPHEAALLKLDISKAGVDLVWRPKMNASQAIQFTIDWYKQFDINRDDIDGFTNSQINNFEILNTEIQ
ncbi:CDP-glucose 4,6-dehydratase [Solitalea lacus]|uniref:CDP-glucose 4,6-dehydratase n=1 Tax=Solitalea lacus TaxID=2911172 RepID=UPI001EDAFA74|nr:CDP-glucose 4,6-dehydratase [Solitalea lacus]UKJ08236.1 CDP-glucose 4,6-dehydratase [Solitalea lacus]